MSASRPQTARPLASAAIVLGVIGLSLGSATGKLTDPLQTSRDDRTKAPRPADPVRINDSAPVIVSQDPAPSSPAISAQGVVLDEDGSPLEEMHVVLRGKVSGGHRYAPGIRHNRDVLARTKTNAEGRFSFQTIRIPPRMVEVINNLRQGKTAAHLLVWGDGKALAWRPIQSFREPAKEIRLLPEADVSGTLIDVEGNPLDKAQLSVIGFTKATADLDAFLNDPGDLNLFTSEAQFRVTAVEGGFVIPHMPKDVRVSVVGRGATGQRSFFQIDTGGAGAATATYRNAGRQQVNVYRTPIKATVQQHPWVRIQVVDHNGNPVSGGGVEAFDVERRYGGSAEVGEDGVAILRVNKPGVHQVRYAQDPLIPMIGMAVAIDIQPEAGPTAEIKLAAAKMLTGRVIDGDSGTPVIGAYVSCWRSLGEQNAPQPTGSTSVSGADGVFRLPVTDGVWKLSFRHQIDGYFVPSSHVRRGVQVQPEDSEVTVTADVVPDNVVLKVARGLIINCRVINDHGRPQAGLRIRGSNDESPFQESFAVTDADGTFELSGFSPYVATRVSTWSQAGTAEQLIPASPDHPWEKTLTRSTVLKLALGTPLTGRVMSDGKPAAGVKVKLRRSRPRPPGQNWIRFSLVSEATTDEDGRYTVTGLQKGDEYRLEIEPSGTTQVRDWVYQSPYSHTLESDDGETIELPDAIMVSNGHSLSGIVVAPDGHPVDGITVSARLASGGSLSRPQNGPPPWTTTEADGRFHLTNLPDEPIALMAYRAGPGDSRILYPSNVAPEMNATNIRIVLDPKLGSGIEDLDAK